MRTYSPTTRSGSVLLDDGTEWPFERRAMERSGLRGLRLGQRVRLIMEDGRIAVLTLATFPDPR